ncbi:hypothetical protein J1N35_045710 [Gossypium stocksii]|uniref:AB hydrolase-1 domain-containing protein n=1 Tax=Gossypium stocksii TaxID=47602 RepID=A0A9D3UBI5_9ROSI|nr:hypothetical protein J1N35_045710 [Gossypium stocksii]
MSAATFNSLTLPFSKPEFPFSSIARTHIPAPTLNLSRFMPNGFLLCFLSSDHPTTATGGQLYHKTNTNSTDPQPTWNWKGYSIRYQCSGSSGPALVLVHGFGADSNHWRKNIPVLAKSHSLCLYNNGCHHVGLVGLQAAVAKPEICRGLFLLNISLRMLHVKKQPWFGRPFIASFQSLLRNVALAISVFQAVMTSWQEHCSRQTFLRIRCHTECYHDTSQVTEEVVQIILHPRLEPGVVDVFLEFICYSVSMLVYVVVSLFLQRTVLIAWGDKDPWESIELGRAYGDFDTVEDFVVLPNVGHCPQDEAPHLVNPLVESFVSRHSKSPANASTTI